MNNPCLECPYPISDATKQNLCNNHENNICKHWLKYQGYMQGRSDMIKWIENKANEFNDYDSDYYIGEYLHSLVIALKEDN